MARIPKKRQSPRRRKKPVPRRVSRIRLYLIGVLWTLAVVGVGFRLYDLQIADAAHLKKLATNQQRSVIELSGKRGEIFDRNLRCLARSITSPSFYAVPERIEQPVIAARRLAAVLNMSSSDLARRLSTSDPFIWLRRKASKTTAKKLLDLKIKGVDWLVESDRIYPRSELAGQLLGFVGIDNNGLEGLEHAFDDVLAGDRGLAVLGRDALRRSYLVGEWVVNEPTNGRNLILTIDEPLQLAVERALQKTVESERAASGMAVVMNAMNGDILAMANVPRFDPDSFKSSPRWKWRNRTVTDLFEPGSGFKVVTLAAGLKSGTFTPDTLVDSSGGEIQVASHTFNDWKTFDDMPLRDVLANSSNVGTIRVATAVGDQALYDTARSLGIGTQTGVSLPGEASGILADPNRWSATSLGAISIGQEVSVNLLQLAVLYAAIANDGYLLEPQIVQRVVSEAPSQSSGHPSATSLHISSPIDSQLDPTHVKKRVLKSDTARALRDMLEYTVNEGTATAAQIGGYRIGGKTGTAQKLGRDGAYSDTESIASFIGFFPVNDPRLVVAVALDEPATHRWASSSAAPLFREIAWESILRFNIAPSEEA